MACNAMEIHSSGCADEEYMGPQLRGDAKFMHNTAAADFDDAA
jgi:hypothetical protein